MFQNIFKTQSFYFSFTYDLTRPFSNIGQATFDDKFCYNSVFMNRFKDRGLESWVQVFICGLVRQKPFILNDKLSSLTLISRRDKSRAGMRFTSRGADSKGNVSNYAETEQLFTMKFYQSVEVYSYLQVRGSIPVIWKQSPNLGWCPKLIFGQEPSVHKAAFRGHIESMKKSYGESHLVNLIDKRGSQKIIGELFSEMTRLEVDKKLHYTWFDFHAECSKMQWQNLAKLMRELQDSIQNFNYGRFMVRGLEVTCLY